jgi:hypothetical protein
MKEKIKPVRVSAWQAAMECQVTVNKIKKGLVQHNIKIGSDGRYSLKEIFLAVVEDQNSLESKAKIAKWEQIIDEAEEARARRIAYRDSLAPTWKLKAYMEDALKQHIQLIRESPMSQKEKEQAIALMRAIELPSFESHKTSLPERRKGGRPKKVS